MKLKINTNNEINLYCEIYHDIDGNIYIEFENQYYYMEINKNDQLEWVLINNFNQLPLINNSKFDYLNIKNINDGKTPLRKKIIEDLEKIKNDDNSDIDEDETLEYKLKCKYNPENKLYYVDNNNDTNDNNEDDLNDVFEESYYKFSIANKSSDKTQTEHLLQCLDRTLDCHSNYDTIVLDDKIILFSSECTHKNSYKITIYLNTGNIELNIIGSKMLNFQTSIINNELLINVIDKKIIF